MAPLEYPAAPTSALTVVVPRTRPTSRGPEWNARLLGLVRSAVTDQTLRVVELGGVLDSVLALSVYFGPATGTYCGDGP